jgi:hypothetical protein
LRFCRRRSECCAYSAGGAPATQYNREAAKVAKTYAKESNHRDYREIRKKKVKANYAGPLRFAFCSRKSSHAAKTLMDRVTEEDTEKECEARSSKLKLVRSGSVSVRLVRGNQFLSSSRFPSCPSRLRGLSLSPKVFPSCEEIDGLCHRVRDLCCDPKCM